MGERGQSIMIKLDPIRLERQKGIVDFWIECETYGTAECATGFGKTVVAMLAIQHLRKSLGIMDVLIIVPTEFLLIQWQKRLLQFDITEGVTVMIINSAIKKHFVVDMLILDEIHRYTAVKFGQIFDRVSYGHILGLTATLPDDDPKVALIYKHCPIVATVSIKECLDNGWIAPFQIYNISVELTDDEQEKYNKLSKEFARNFATFGHDFHLAMECVTNVDTRKRYAISQNWSESRVTAAAFQWIRNMSKRKEMLYNMTSKKQMTLDLIALFSDRKIITFSQTIESADWLNDKLGSISEVYHSKVKGRYIKGTEKKLTTAKSKQYSIDRFASRDRRNVCRVLCTAKAMDQGADIPDIDMAIIVSASGKVQQAIQRYGRTLRIQDGKRVIIIELYVKGTQDEKWLRTRQKKTPREQISWIKSVEEIQ